MNDNVKVEAFKLPKLDETNLNENAEEVKNSYVETVKAQIKEVEKKPIQEEKINPISIESIDKITTEINVLKNFIADESSDIKSKINKISLEEIIAKLDIISNETQDIKLAFKEQSDLLLGQDINNNLIKLTEYGKHLDDKIEKMQEKNTMLVRKILKKILNKEITDNSDKIVRNTFDIIYNEIKASSKIDLYVSQKDYEFIKDVYIENTIVNIISDNNIKPGHCLIISDNANFDNNLDKKLDLILESIF